MSGVGQTLVIRTSQAKSLLGLLGGLAFVAGGVWMVGAPQTATRYPAAWVTGIGWACIIFFGWVVLLGFARLISPSVIRLTPAALTVDQWPKKRTVRWSSIESFLVWEHRGARLAAWRLHKDAPEHGMMSAINGGFGIHGSANGHWEKSPEELVEIFRDWKARHAMEAVADETPMSSPSPLK